MVTEAAIKHGGWKRTAGLCNVPITHRKTAAEILDVPEQDLFFKFAGINHFHWHRVWDKDDNERTGELIELIYGSSEKVDSRLKNIYDAAFSYEQLRDLGLLPCSYHRYYYAEDEMLEHSVKEFNQGETRAQVVKTVEARLFELYKDPKLDYKPKELEERGGTYYSEAACELIASIKNDKRTDMVVSTLNNGTIVDLPYDSIVEVSASVTGHGPEPYNWGSFPPAARGIIQLMKGMEETTIRAAITGDYGAALHAFTINPLIPSGKTARKLLDGLLIAHKRHLPQFKAAIDEIERTQPETVRHVEELLKNS